MKSVGERRKEEIGEVTDSNELTTLWGYTNLLINIVIIINTYL